MYFKQNQTIFKVYKLLKPKVIICPTELNNLVCDKIAQSLQKYV